MRGIVPGFRMLHSCYFQQNTSEDAVFGCMKHVETGEKELFCIKNPKIKVWVTKPALRNHSRKKEYADLREVDEVQTRYNEIATHIGPMVGIYARNNNFYNTKKVLASPYVYGADVDICVRVRIAFNTVTPKKIPYLNVGNFDIETSVLGDNRIIVISFIDGSGKAYCGCLKDFLKSNESVEDIKSRYEKKVRQNFEQAISPKVKSMLEKHPITVEWKILDEELDLIKWIFEKIHFHKPDYITIWNMGFDIPKLLERLQFLEVDPAEIMCHPDVPKKYRKVEYAPSRMKQNDHIVDRWDWFYLTGYTQFIDAMCLYGRLRKAKGRDISYRLDYIGAKEIGAGKLDFGQNKTHYEMQVNDGVGYTVYNLVDSEILNLMNLKTKDLDQFVNLLGLSNPEDFNKQSVMLKNYYFDWLQPKGKVPPSVGESLEIPSDRYIVNRGGLVINVNNTFGTGVAIIKENKQLTRVMKFVFDIDAKSLYPSITEATNCSKETKVTTVLHIDNSGRIGKVNVDDVEMPDTLFFNVEDFFNHAIFAFENSVMLGNRYFELPSYQEMTNIFKHKENER